MSEYMLVPNSPFLTGGKSNKLEHLKNDKSLS